MSYYINKIIPTDFDSAIKRVTENLKSEGFGISTEIDVQETLIKKINVDFRRYIIYSVLAILQMHTKHYQTNLILD